MCIVKFELKRGKGEMAILHTAQKFWWGRQLEECRPALLQATSWLPQPEKDNLRAILLERLIALKVQTPQEAFAVCRRSAVKYVKEIRQRGLKLASLDALADPSDPESGTVGDLIANPTDGHERWERGLAARQLLGLIPKQIRQLGAKVLLDSASQAEKNELKDWRYSVQGLTLSLLYEALDS